ncbi:MAG TPA: hypothetical protein VF665_23875 [Longimicrobium sp.]|uniref:hypothetical protein n=1 Tax=Longimicrobium sp. TaxID=2029185 RepID=UPI002ED8AA3D
MNTCLFVLCLSLGGGNRAPALPDSWIGEDKLKHFFVSFAVTSLAASGARAAGLSRDASTLVGVGTGVSVGAWKEWSDRNAGTGTPSFRDFAWDLGGVGVAAAVQQQTSQ